MSKDKYDSEIEFNRLMARNKHLEKMVRWYKPPEEWENLRDGDTVIIDNSDSLHDGIKGKFLAHDWAISGYVRLVVVFPDGKHCYYLPTQVTKVYEEQKMKTRKEYLSMVMIFFLYVDEQKLFEYQTKQKQITLIHQTEIQLKIINQQKRKKTKNKSKCRG